MQPLFTASPISTRPVPPANPPLTQRTLPNRNVDSASIEDAFVAFILYCNPAVPLEADTAALREAFRTPPKSGGKSFSTVVLFELIKKLDTKELKTWAELALKLGVEPPDQEKGESSQKIQQYAVRLKRWMHSMHVDAFFEYLIGRQSPYWTQIPPEHTPVTELEREGVAAEDDMALRALLPEIKPRRGRKRPEEDESSKSPSRRPSPQAGEDGGQARQGGTEPWTAQPDGRGSVFLFPPLPDSSRTNQSGGPPWSNNDIAQTPLTAFPPMPQSAITPSTRNSFWADEPKSAITPLKARSSGRRHGAKAVSSAWRSGGIGGSGKTRGRPPINRGANNEGPFSAFPTASEGPIFRFPSPTPEQSTSHSHAATTATTRKPLAETSTSATQGAPPQAPPAQAATQPSPIHETVPVPPRPAKRSRLSLQVPERVGGEVRLATPPLPEQVIGPTVTVNGQPTESPNEPATRGPPDGSFKTIYSQSPGTFVGPLPLGEPQILFQDPTDRTNMNEVEAFFVSCLLKADWYDATHNPTPPGSVGEAWAISQRVIENLLKAAPTKEAFLINLAALTGGSLLLHKGSLRVTRLEELPDRTRYSCTWQLRFGDMIGNWAMEETVMHEKGKEKNGGGIATTGGSTTASGGANGPNAGAENWELKYKELAASLQQRDEELLRLKAKLIESIRDC